MIGDVTQTDLAKAKGYGSTKRGMYPWWYQRFTAFILLFLSCWMIIFCLKFFTTYKSFDDFALVMSDPKIMISIIILVLISFYHGALGVKVIIEDYISTILFRNLLLIILQTFTFITIVALIVAIVYFIVNF